MTQRQEAITLRSRVMIIGGDILFFKRGRTVFFLPVHNLLKTCCPKVAIFVMAPVYSDCCCIFKFSNQMQLLKFCYFFSSFQYTY